MELGEQIPGDAGDVPDAGHRQPYAPCTGIDMGGASAERDKTQEYEWMSTAVAAAAVIGVPAIAPDREDLRHDVEKRGHQLGMEVSAALRAEQIEGLLDRPGLSVWRRVVSASNRSAMATMPPSMGISVPLRPSGYPSPFYFL